MMTKPKKRLSAGMGLSADGIDPLFEFDVPRIFADLTLPPRCATATGERVHDAWFDLVHDSHSRPTAEFLAAQQQEQAQSEAAPTFHRPFQHHHSDADGEKENASASASGGATRLKRRNVAYSGHVDAAPVGTLKATMRTVSATAKTVTASGGTAVKKPSTKLPFGNSTSASSTKSSGGSKGNTQALARKRPVAERSTEASKARSRGRPVAKAHGDKDLEDLQALLAKHNKKFKANHTYEPRQHSVRDVRMVRPWIKAL
jgi:hypothetical protein